MTNDEIEDEIEQEIMSRAFRDYCTSHYCNNGAGRKAVIDSRKKCELIDLCFGTDEHNLPILCHNLEEAYRRVQRA